MTLFHDHRSPMLPCADHRGDVFVDGRWTPSTSGDVIDVVSPMTEQVIGAAPRGTAADVDRAVAAARRALRPWALTDPQERLRVLVRLTELIEENTESLAALITAQVGTPIAVSRRVQVGLPLRVLTGFAESLPAIDREYSVGRSVVVRRPVGVVGCITPWNYPLYQMVAKVGAALAAGCTVVAKPSEVAPLDAMWLADALTAAGLPPGVFNLVCGTGPEVGEAVAGHPDVDAVSFTGSTGAGRRVAELAGRSLARVTLELGGKSANILLDDVDLAAVVPTAVARCFVNNGQTCSALTRLLVPRHVHDQAARLAREAAEEGFQPGDPFDDRTTLGPLVTEVQRDRVRSLIRQGVDDGARLETGGTQAPVGLATGWYVRPTVFSSVDNAMAIAREEIFGPVLCVIPYEDEDDAIRLANDSPYGLSGGVSSADPIRARRVAERLETGHVVVNGASFNACAPFGGVKQSGYGRELGQAGIEEFLVETSLQL